MDALTPLSTSQTFIPPLGLLNRTLLCFYKPPLRGWIQSWIWAPLSLHKGLDSISSASMHTLALPMLCLVALLVPHRLFALSHCTV